MKKLKRFNGRYVGEIVPVCCRLRGDVVGLLEDEAEKLGMPPSTLATLWLTDAIHQKAVMFSGREENGI